MVEKDTSNNSKSVRKIFNPRTGHFETPTPRLESEEAARKAAGRVDITAQEAVQATRARGREVKSPQVATTVQALQEKEATQEAPLSAGQIIRGARAGLGEQAGIGRLGEVAEPFVRQPSSQKTFVKSQTTHLGGAPPPVITQPTQEPVKSRVGGVTQFIAGKGVPVFYVDPKVRELEKERVKGVSTPIIEQPERTQEVVGMIKGEKESFLSKWSPVKRVERVKESVKSVAEDYKDWVKTLDKGGYERRVERIREREEAAAERSERVSDVFRVVPGLKGDNYWQQVGRNILAAPTRLTVGFGEQVLITGSKLTAAGEGLIYKDSRSEVVEEFKSAGVKTPMAVVRAYDPRSPEGLVNLAITGAAVVGLGYGKAKSRGITPEKGSVKTSGSRAYTKGKGDTSISVQVEKGSYTSQSGKQLRYSVKTEFKGGSSTGTYTARIIDSSGNVVKTSTGKIGRTVTLESGTAPDTYKVGTETVVRPKGSLSSKEQMRADIIVARKSAPKGRDVYTEYSETATKHSGRGGGYISKGRYIADVKGQGKGAVVQRKIKGQIDIPQTPVRTTIEKAGAKGIEGFAEIVKESFPKGKKGQVAISRDKGGITDFTGTSDFTGLGRTTFGESIIGGKTTTTTPTPSPDPFIFKPSPSVGGVVVRSAGFKPSLSVVPLQVTDPKVDSGVVPKYDVKPAGVTKPKTEPLAPSKPITRADIVPDSVPEDVPSVVPDVDTFVEPKVDTDTSPRPDFTPSDFTDFKVRTTPPISPPIVPFVPLPTWRMGAGFTFRGKGFRFKGKQRKKFTPSGFSATFKISGKPTKFGEISGLGLRPIRAEKFSVGKTGKKKRKRKGLFRI